MKRSIKLLSLILAMACILSAFSGCDFMRATEEDDSMDAVYIDQDGEQVAVTEALKLGVRNMGYRGIFPRAQHSTRRGLR